MDRRRLALIHIIKKELALPDAEYRATLRAVAGVDSARDLDEAGFRKLMRYLVRSRHYVVSRRGLTLRQKLYIEHLQNGLGWSEMHLSNFLRKYYRREALTELSRREGIKVIESLKHVLERHPPAAGGPGGRTPAAEPAVTPSTEDDGDGTRASVS